MTMGRPRTVSDEQVLAGAARVIARVGPARLTLAEVGREVGLSAATLVQRFGSKRGVLLAVAAHGADALPRRVAGAKDASAPAATLIEILAEVAGTIRSSEEFANHLAFLLLDMSDPQFRQISRDYAAAVERAIADALAAGQTAGELIKGDLSRLSRAIHAAYNGALIAWGLSGDGSPAERVREQLTLLLGPYLEPTGPVPPRPAT
ncbi:TetR/AcrR family transcriptional regulator [Microtetraspora malaysiensis]|uniref:TetR/AcrR family transcriptional regulator n=1 Tax=Microtetraspora malaysiensis TaxID=161358 RepID=UPI0008348DF5|nr:TetR/AcrR family transcriptional regulator [Microtetraspora malaysiensis]